MTSEREEPVEDRLKQVAERLDRATRDLERLVNVLRGGLIPPDEGEEAHE
jgi:hypothetical protein